MSWAVRACICSSLFDMSSIKICITCTSNTIDKNVHMHTHVLYLLLHIKCSARKINTFVHTSLSCNMQSVLYSSATIRPPLFSGATKLLKMSRTWVSTTRCRGFEDSVSIRTGNPVKVWFASENYWKRSTPIFQSHLLNFMHGMEKAEWAKCLQGKRSAWLEALPSISEIRIKYKMDKS